jgi:hypothetical protein
VYTAVLKAKFVEPVLAMSNTCGSGLPAPSGIVI